ncbi:MAG: AzlC family ABC transporter permease [Desulfobacterales bacterium]|nr:AzlC family ABC transporter permease [Desulfobacterales bacterium]
MKHGFSAVFKQGAVGAWPICLGYIPIGLAFGVLAQKAGLTPLETGMMSVLVFAGSAQFIAVSMIDAGASAVAIVLTTFVVNLRHFLMSSALAVPLRGTSAKKLVLFSYGVTDESFAVNMNRFNTGGWDVDRSLVVNHVANAVWVVSTVAGGFSGRFIPDGAFGIDYALIAMFICLLVFQVRGGIYVLTAVISGVAAIGLSLVIPGNLYVVIASILAATAGVFIKKKLTKGMDRG